MAELGELRPSRYRAGRDARQERDGGRKQRDGWASNRKEFLGKLPWETGASTTGRRSRWSEGEPERGVLGSKHRPWELGGAAHKGHHGAVMRARYLGEAERALKEPFGWAESRRAEQGQSTARAGTKLSHGRAGAREDGGTPGIASYRRRNSAQRPWPSRGPFRRAGSCGAEQSERSRWPC